jgi:hypothetical protein
MAYIGQTPTAVALDGDDLANDIITLAKMASGTDGNIISYDASGNPVAIATGSSGQVLTSGGAGAAPAFAGGGKVLQVIQTHNVTGVSQSLTANTIANITNLSAAITPTATSSKILVMVNWSGEVSTAVSQDVNLGLKRGATVVGSPTSEGSRIPGIMPLSINYVSANNDSTPESCVYQYLDSPSTASAVTYYATAECSGNTTLYSCRTVADSDSSTYDRTTTTMTLMEIGA